MVESDSIKWIKLSIACACKRISGFCHIASEDIPLPMVVCHCTTCRHSSGLLCVSHISISPRSSILQIYGQPYQYRTSSLIRFFCGFCGCSLYRKRENSQKVDLCTGALDSPDLTKMHEHIFVADTIDGGLSDWIPNANKGKERQKESSSLNEVARLKPSETLQEISPKTQSLKGYCHCRGVQFTVHRPSHTPSINNVPWPDLIMPYHLDFAENSGDLKWWLRANNEKYLAGTCACHSCRLGSGYDIQTWAFIPKANLTQGTGQDLNYFAGTLRQYESSMGTYREFCRVCGATVFWHSDDRPDIVDVSVGLLDSDEGARAEDWLEWWTGRVSFEELALNKGYISSLSQGLKNWGERISF